MEPASEQPLDQFGQPSLPSFKASRRSSRHAPRLHEWCDGLSEGLIYLAIVFGPWAFGTTQAWSIWTLNGISYCLGVLLLAKHLMRWWTGYRPQRWMGAGSDSTAGVSSEPGSSGKRQGAPASWGRFLTPGLAVLTILILGYTLASAINARATFHASELRIEYYPCLKWLPHSYDAPRTWFALAQYLGWALLFWSLRDWLLGKARPERHGSSRERIQRFENAALASSGFAGDKPLGLPVRLRRLLWVICLNGILLAGEGIVQRMTGTNKLLGLVLPRFNRTAESQFGPYAYRSTASQYLNLVWPLGVGFCWVLARRAASLRAQGLRVRRHHLILVPGLILMAASPIIATTRGGAIIAALCLALIALVLAGAMSKSRWQQRLGVIVLVLVPLELALFLGWTQLRPRFERLFSDGLGGRESIYTNAREMAADHPVFGTGAGTFTWLYYFYRGSAAEIWQGYVHDDWLELRITFGWVGFGMILLCLVPVATFWFKGQGIEAPWVLIAGVWIALVGCLTHAAYDLPMQVHSVVVMFLVNCCLGVCIVRPRSIARQV